MDRDVLFKLAAADVLVKMAARKGKKHRAGGAAAGALGGLVGGLAASPLIDAAIVSYKLRKLGKNPSMEQVAKELISPTILDEYVVSSRKWGGLYSKLGLNRLAHPSAVIAGLGAGVLGGTLAGLLTGSYSAGLGIAGAGLGALGGYLGGGRLLRINRLANLAPAAKLGILAGTTGLGALLAGGLGGYLGRKLD